MSKSLFLTCQSLEEYRVGLDNLYIAKILHDMGKPLPADTTFDSPHFYLDSVFFKAFETLFEGEIQTYGVDFEDNPEEIIFSINGPLISQWQRVVKAFPEASKVTAEILKPISSVSCDRFDMEMKSALIDDGLQIIILGYYGIVSKFVGRLVECYNHLQEQVEIWAPKLREA